MACIHHQTTTSGGHHPLRANACTSSNISVYVILVPFGPDPAEPFDPAEHFGPDPAEPLDRQMRLPRLTIQRWMVVLAMLAVACWAGSAIGPDLLRRWTACRQEAAWHARIAARLQATLTLRAKTAASTGMPVRDSRAMERRLRYHAALSCQYRRALYIPWEFYRLGDTISPK